MHWITLKPLTVYGRVLCSNMQLEIPDNSTARSSHFFRSHPHCTTFGNEVSEFWNIMASIIHESESLALVQHRMVSQPLQLSSCHTSDFMVKYADDTDPVVHRAKWANVHSCEAENSHTEDRATLIISSWAWPSLEKSSLHHRRAGMPSKFCHQPLLHSQVSNRSRTSEWQ